MGDTGGNYRSSASLGLLGGKCKLDLGDVFLSSPERRHLPLDVEVPADRNDRQDDLFGRSKVFFWSLSHKQHPHISANPNKETSHKSVKSQLRQYIDKYKSIQGHNPNKVTGQHSVKSQQRQYDTMHTGLFSPTVIFI